jgi:hypothetical protein
MAGVEGMRGLHRAVLGHLGGIRLALFAARSEIRARDIVLAEPSSRFWRILAFSRTV